MTNITFVLSIKDISHKGDNMRYHTSNEKRQNINKNISKKQNTITKRYTDNDRLDRTSQNNSNAVCYAVSVSLKEPNVLLMIEVHIR